MKPPTVSIVMAAKNYARFLPEAVDSALAQTFADWELVIVDDGSTDGTCDIVRPCLADARIRYFRSDSLGQSRAKNLGIGFSRGEFIAFLDADDAWFPTKLAKQVALLQSMPEVGVTYTQRELIDETGKSLGFRNESLPGGRILPTMFLQNFVCFSSAMVRREVFESVGVFDSALDLSIDYDLWLRAAAHFEFRPVDEVLVKYRTGHGNLSKKLADRVATAIGIMNRTVRRNPELPERTVAQGYVSTCQTLGYVMRSSEPRTAAKWYASALRWPSGRRASLKGLAACGLRWMSGKRAVGSAENAGVNG
jgi:glycosyltransferase involved in cell wall biosynthesis